MLHNSFYRVTIDGAGLTDSGFIDNRSYSYYLAEKDEQGALLPEDQRTPSDLAHAEAKASANIRYRQIIDGLQGMSNANVSNVTTEGAHMNTPAGSFGFTCSFDRDEYVFTPDELNPGQTLYGTDAVRRIIARTLMSGRTVNHEVYGADPPAANSTVNYGDSSFPYRPNLLSTRSLTVAPLVAVPDGETPYAQRFNETLPDAEGRVTVEPIANATDPYLR